ncbi:MAG: threonine synthase [Marivibrio sp.]|uniref:threonine synthase n=1 Tax=Marivibrio sp. TaxID=2039719 RepID=UPI0032ECC8BE
MTYVTHLECSLTGETYPAGQVHGLSAAGRPLLVRYDLERMAAELSKERLAASIAAGFWRYADFLPVERSEDRISLGEVVTPLIGIDRWGASIGAAAGSAIVKDEGRLPTGSFKARGLALAVSMAKQFGIDHMAIPTNGNAGAALAAYARRAGIRATVFCPEDTPDINIREIRQQGAATYKVNGLINDCGKIVGGGKEHVGWFDVSTLKEPYRIEGKKTMGLELAEQFAWRLPEVIFYPTGGGTGLIGMWKAFHELTAMGWLDGPLPRMIAVQAEGCAPIVKAYEAGEEHAPLWENAATVAAGIRVPVAVGDFLILRAVRESGGRAVAVPDAEIMATRDRIAADEGLLLCPEGAATAAAYQRALAEGWVGAEERAILFNCATGLKYPMAEVTSEIDKDQPIDYAAFG